MSPFVCSSAEAARSRSKPIPTSCSRASAYCTPDVAPAIAEPWDRTDPVFATDVLRDDELAWLRIEAVLCPFETDASEEAALMKRLELLLNAPPAIEASDPELEGPGARGGLGDADDLLAKLARAAVAPNEGESGPVADASERNML